MRVSWHSRSLQAGSAVHHHPHRNPLPPAGEGASISHTKRIRAFARRDSLLLQAGEGPGMRVSWHNRSLQLGSALHHHPHRNPLPPAGEGASISHTKGFVRSRGADSLLPQAGEGLGMRVSWHNRSLQPGSALHHHPHPNPLPPAGEGAGSKPPLPFPKHQGGSMYFTHSHTLIARAAVRR